MPAVKRTAGLIPAKVKKWTGPKPTVCDICGGGLEGTFVDGKTRFGPWGILCGPCHDLQGIGLGTGRGQKYDAETLVKVGG